MKYEIQLLIILLLGLCIMSCSVENATTDRKNVADIVINTTQAPSEKIPIVKTRENPIQYLALGDSYTIGQSVCEKCTFPAQLKNSLQNTNLKNNFGLKIIAQTGWTTTNLIAAIENANLTPNYDLVTLLIGVNNQFQRQSFSLYQKEFPELVTKSIALAKGDKSKVIVVSIPDYAYTPAGEGFGNTSTISEEINKYNEFAANYCQDNSVPFISITEITRGGIADKELVATDGLHPSEKAYRLFVERIAPLAANLLNN